MNLDINVDILKSYNNQLQNRVKSKNLLIVRSHINKILNSNKRNYVSQINNNSNIKDNLVNNTDLKVNNNLANTKPDNKNVFIKGNVISKGILISK